MFDIAALTSALGSLKIIIDLAKGMNNAQVSSQVVSAVIDAQSRLLTVQEQALELQRENQMLQAEINTLRSNAQVFYEGNDRWERLPDGTIDGPLCDACWGFETKRIHMERDERRNHPDYVVYLCVYHNAVVDARIPKSVLDKHNIR